MTGYERFIKALKKEEPDRVPIWESTIDKPVMEKLFGNISKLDFYEKMDLDGIMIKEDFYRKKIAKNTYIDDWGAIWKLSSDEIFYPFNGPIKSFKDLKNFNVPDPDDPKKYAGLEEAVKRFKNQKAIVFCAHENFELSHILSGGIDKLLINYILEPKFVEELSEVVWDYKKKTIKNALSIGADVIFTGDDYANQMGPMMSPEHFKKFILPYLKMAVELVHKSGAFFIKHTDGNLWRILDDIIDSGIDGLHPLEIVADMDIKRLKEEHGREICLIGNIDCARLLPHGTRKEVKEAVLETIAKAAPGGGYIISSSNTIHPGVDAENYKTMIETARKYGGYPIDKNLIENYKNINYIK